MLNPKFIQVFKNFLQAFKKELKTCRKRPATKVVHNLRVSTRRILTSLEVIQQLQPELKISSCSRELRQLMRPAGRLRNIHIQVQWIEKLFPRIGAGLNEYLKVLERRRKSAQQKLLKQVLAFNFKSCRKLLKNLKEQVSELESEAIFLDQGLSLLKNQYQELGQFEEKIQDPKNIDSLHQFRLAFKSYRYTVEILGTIVSSVSTEMIESMHQFQIILGELHDLDILENELVRFSKSKKRTQYELGELKRALRKLRRARRSNFVKFLPALQMAMNTFHPDKFRITQEKTLAPPLIDEIGKGRMHPE